MSNKIIKISILCFLAGAMCKIYDDFNDNMLYDKLEILKPYREKKEFINEFLKTLHTLLITYTSSNSVLIMFYFVCHNLLQFLFLKSGYEEPYEYSGIIVFTLWGVYLLFDNINEILQNYHLQFMLAFLGFNIIMTSIFDLFMSNMEYSYRKFGIRLFASLFHIAILIANNYFKIVPNDVIVVFYYYIGYCLTSCVFQLLLLNMKHEKETTPTTTTPTNLESMEVPKNQDVSNGLVAVNDAEDAETKDD